MRAQLNKHDSTSQLCAAGFTETTSNSKTFCTKSDTNAGCSAMVFETFGFTFSQICGYVLGYKFWLVKALPV